MSWVKCAVWGFIAGGFGALVWAHYTHPLDEEDAGTPPDGPGWRPVVVPDELEDNAA